MLSKILGDYYIKECSASTAVSLSFSHTNSHGFRNVMFLVTGFIAKKCQYQSRVFVAALDGLRSAFFQRAAYHDLKPDKCYQSLLTQITGDYFPLKMQFIKYFVTS
jgi:hypothetical protein